MRRSYGIRTFAFWNSRSITHLANYPSRSLPMISSNESQIKVDETGQSRVKEDHKAPDGSVGRNVGPYSASATERFRFQARSFFTSRRMRRFQSHDKRSASNVEDRIGGRCIAVDEAWYGWTPCRRRFARSDRRPTSTARTV
jgi:hypothetical protein